MLVCEQEGDRITHDIIQRLNRRSSRRSTARTSSRSPRRSTTSSTSSRRSPTSSGSTGSRRRWSRPSSSPRVLHQACRAIAEAIPRLRDFKDIRHYTVEINRLENDGDRVAREALASLFDHGIDPMVVIRWKDIFERLEDAIDATETVANILEGIVIKNT